MLSTLVLNRIFETLALYSEKGEYVNEIKYEEPDLFGGIEGIDYRIIYGFDNEEVEMEAAT